MKSNKFSKFILKHWITIWLAIVILGATVFGVYAMYADFNNKIKRVVTPAAINGSYFTSNYLSTGSSNIRYAYFNPGETLEYDVVIRNYNPADPTNVFGKTFNYTLTAELVHNNGIAYNAVDDATALAAMTSGGKSITITTGTGENEDTITLDGSHLSGNSSKTHTLSTSTTSEKWKVTCTNIELNSDYCIKLTATPDITTNLDTISATIVVSTYPVSRQSGWFCNLVESGTIDDYDAFNYTIIGNGKYNLLFSYDATEFEINPAFYLLDYNIDAPVDYGDESGHSGWKTVVIHADPEETNISRYDLQLFKTNSQTYPQLTFSVIDPNNTTAPTKYVEFQTASYTSP